MFESVKHWLESLNKESKLFIHYDDEALHIALASVLYRIIRADNNESKKEKRVFSAILTKEFNLSVEQVDHLYQRVHSLNSQLNDDLETIRNHLKENPVLRMQFMEKLNQLVNIDNVNDLEIDVFNQTRQVLFPDIDNE